LVYNKKTEAQNEKKKSGRPMVEEGDIAAAAKKQGMTEHVKEFALSLYEKRRRKR